MPPLNPKLHLPVLFSLQEAPFNNKSPLNETHHHLHLCDKFGGLLFSPYSTTRGFFLVKQIQFYYKEKDFNDSVLTLNRFVALLPFL